MSFAPILGALKYLPASVARKALEKVSPKFGDYFARAAAFGVDVNRAVDFLSDRFQSDSQKQYKEQLQRGAQNNTLRPDEMLSRSEMRNQALPAKFLKTVGSFATGAVLGSNKEKNLPTIQEEKNTDNTNQEKKASIIQPKNAQEAVRQYNARQKPQSAIDQLKTQYDQAYGQNVQPPPEQDNFYKKAFNSLKRGTVTVDGKYDPTLAEAKPYYERGQIQSPENLKDFYELYFAKRQDDMQQQGQRQSQGQMGQMQQGAQPGQKRDQIMHGISQLAQAVQSLRDL